MTRTTICAAAFWAAFMGPALAQPDPRLDSSTHAPTGGVNDPHVAAPTPGMDSSTTGRSEVNARTNGGQVGNVQTPHKKRPHDDRGDRSSSGQ